MKTENAENVELEKKVLEADIKIDSAVPEQKPQPTVNVLVNLKTRTPETTLTAYHPFKTLCFVDERSAKEIHWRQQNQMRDEMSLLQNSIKAEGIRDPIVVWIEPKSKKEVIVDGHRRYMLATRNKLTYPTIELNLPTEYDVQLWIINNQLGRKNLSTYQRGKLILYKKDILENEAKKRMTAGAKIDPSKPGCLGPKGRTLDILGVEVGLSGETLRKINTIEKSTDKDLISKAISGEMSIGEAYRKVHKDNIMNCKREKQNTIPDDLPAIADRYQLFNKDFRDITDNEIPNNSIKWIITDPPYEGKDLDIFDPFGKWCADKLVEGGSALVMMGQYYLDRIIQDLSKHLQYHWLLSYFMPGKGNSVMVKKVNCGYKPILWFVKGSYVGGFVHDVIKSDAPDKQYHPHGQSVFGFANIVKAFTLPGDTILDPFLGGGTTGEASIINDRLFIGIEKDKNHFDVAKHRLSLLNKEKEATVTTDDKPNLSLVEPDNSNIVGMPTVNTDLKTAG